MATSETSRKPTFGRVTKVTGGRTREGDLSEVHKFIDHNAIQPVCILFYS